jgi:hypothetical protein
MAAIKVGTAIAPATVMISGKVSPPTESISLLKKRSSKCHSKRLNWFGDG